MECLGPREVSRSRLPNFTIARHVPAVVHETFIRIKLRLGVPINLQLNPPVLNSKGPVGIHEPAVELLLRQPVVRIDQNAHSVLQFLLVLEESVTSVISSGITP